MSNNKNTYYRYKQESEDKTKEILELMKTITKLNNYIDSMEDKLVQKDKLIEKILDSTLSKQSLKNIENETVKKWLEIKQKTIDKINNK